MIPEDVVLGLLLSGGKILTSRLLSRLGMVLGIGQVGVRLAGKCVEGSIY